MAGDAEPGRSEFRPETMRMEVVDFAARPAELRSRGAKFVLHVSQPMSPLPSFCWRSQPGFLLKRRHIGFCQRSMTVEHRHFGLLPARVGRGAGDAESSYCAHRQPAVMNLARHWRRCGKTPMEQPAPLTRDRFPDCENPIPTHFRRRHSLGGWASRATVVLFRSSDREVEGIFSARRA